MNEMRRIASWLNQRSQRLYGRIRQGKGSNSAGDWVILIATTSSDSVDNVVDGDSDSIENPKSKRDQWGGQIEFILTLVGYAVGLGNVWRFPYLCYRNGGGAFLIPYVISLVFLGIPLFYLELCLGQFASLGPLTVWKVNPLFKGVGYGSVMVTWIISLYYNVIIAYCIYYFFASMTSTLPWSTCDNAWNSVRCLDETKHFNTTTFLNSSIIKGLTSEEYGKLENLSMVENMTVKYMKSYVQNITGTFLSPPEDYFDHQVLDMSAGIDQPGTIKWDIALCLLLAWVVVFFVLVKGIKSLGKIVYFTAIFPYVLLTVLLVRGVTLDGAAEGIHFYLTPQWDRLTDAKVWSDAAVQIFYSLGVASGGIVAMSSYNKFNNNTLRDALLVPLINCLTSFYAGFVIFSVLGYMAHQKGVHVKDVATQGPGLVFVAYPEALRQMPISPLWAILFFLMLCTLGFSSQFSLMETVITGFMDEFKTFIYGTKRKVLFRFFVCALSFLLGLPMVLNGGIYLLNLVDIYVSSFPLLFIGLFEITAIVWVYGIKNFLRDIDMMLGGRFIVLFRYFFIGTWCFLGPVLLMGVIVATAFQYQPATFNDYIYPTWATGALGFLIVAFPLIFIPGFMLFACFKNGLGSVLQKSKTPDASYGPALKENRTGTYGFTEVVTHPQSNKIQHIPNDHFQMLDTQPDNTQNIPNDGIQMSNMQLIGQSNQAFELEKF